MTSLTGSFGLTIQTIRYLKIFLETDPFDSDENFLNILRLYQRNL